ncbi:MAG: polysaccharide deacetylase family protein [Agriterribacter sp.]
MNKIILVVLITVSALACTKETTLELNEAITDQQPEDTLSVSGRKASRRSGVVFTFDDTFVDEWYSLNNVVPKKYNWKATFFVTAISSMTNAQKTKLRYLQAYGHEIGGHGYQHLNAAEYIRNNDAASYINTEITPMLKVMRENGLRVQSFAYPYGGRNKSTDSLLLRYFSMLRGTTSYNFIENIQDLGCYYNFDASKLVLGVGIDKIYNTPTDYLISLLKYAKANNKIVIFYGHRPMLQAADGQYQTSYSTILDLCKYANDNNIPFYRMNDINGLR